MKRFLLILVAILIAFIVGYTIPSLKVSKLEEKNGKLSKKLDELSSRLLEKDRLVSQYRDEIELRKSLMNLFIDFENRNFGNAIKSLENFQKGVNSFLKNYGDSPYGKKLKEFLDSEDSKRLEDIVKKGDLKDLKSLEEIVISLLN